MINLLRLLPLIVVIILVDFSFFELVFQAICQGNERWVTTIFWSIPFLAIGGLYFFPRTSSRAIQEPIRRDFHSSILIVYLARFLIVILFSILSLIIGSIIGVLNLFDIGLFDDFNIYYSLRLVSIVIVMLLALSLFWGMFVNRYRYKVHEVDVTIDNLPSDLEGFTLVQLSDIHSGSFTNPKFLEKGIAKINSLKPDMVCFTGDLVNNVAEEIEPYISSFSKINAKKGVFAILGNHDYGDYIRWRNHNEKSNNLNQLIAVHDVLGWHLLRDNAVQIPVGESKISIIGVENISAKGRFKRYGNLDMAHKSSSKADLKILLSHDPSHWRDEVLNYPDIQLCLSGHTHGMQFGIEWGNFIKWSPIQYIYKEWAGLYQEGKQYLYVNRGFGFLGYPGRVGILPEITKIRFKRTSDY